MTISKMVRWVGYSAHMGEVSKLYCVLARNHMDDLGIGGSMILKWILKD
jgi:hypothetical protein